MSKKLVLLGAGHAHMTVMFHLDQYLSRGYEVSVVGPGPRHYYSGMGPGMLGGTYTPEEISFPVQEMVTGKGATFVTGRAVRIAPDERTVHLEDGTTLTYDVLSCNVGSFVPPMGSSPTKQEGVFPVKPIESLLRAQEFIRSHAELYPDQPLRIGIAGGGPAALEVAGNAHLFCTTQLPNHPIQLTIFAGKKLLSRFSPRIQQLVQQSLAERSISVNTNGYVENIAPGAITLQSGTTHKMDVIFAAPGIRPSSLFEASGLETGPDGGLLVDRFLRCPKYPEIFGGGDCINFRAHPLDKVGVYAVRQNPILHHNIMATLDETAPVPFLHTGPYLLIFNMGDGTGLFIKGSFVGRHKLFFMLKDWIDRKFMKEFQL